MRFRWPHISKSARPYRFTFESLESRRTLSSVPFGASSLDTAEYMLGDVLVSVVLIESDGSKDVNSENWTQAEKTTVKQRVEDGLNWWEQQLAARSSLHHLDFHLDYTYTDSPIVTGYEPIARKSDDFNLWIEDFFTQANVPSGDDFSQRIRAFNHRQRELHDTNWAFTIFVVDSSADIDKRFAAGGSFQQSFAYAGGRFFVTTSERPASAIAHETAHMFWAMDEYSGSRSYLDRRGYYNTQNTNALDNNPQPALRVASLMDSHESAFALKAISNSALEMIGWKDSDGDGIFDVLDVPHLLIGQGFQDQAKGTFRFEGVTQVQTLPNLNPSGTGNDMTINRIHLVQYRFDISSDWSTALVANDYQVNLSFEVNVPQGATRIEIRSVDANLGVVSDTFREELDIPSNSPWHNALNSLDVNADRLVTPIDALLVINRLNAIGAGPLAEGETAFPYIDTNGDRVASPMDALLVINYLNQSAQATASARVSSSSVSVDFHNGEGEDVSLVASVVESMKRRRRAVDQAMEEIE